MRRALVGIVPDELLNRKRKAFVARAPIGLVSPAAASGGLTETVKDMVSARLGMVNSTVFSETLQKVGRGIEVPLAPLIRTLNIESWLRTVTDQKLLDQRQLICVRNSALLPKTRALTESPF
jgi:asparagine synthase (glutamine-hydrolysing)